MNKFIYFSKYFKNKSFLLLLSNKLQIIYIIKIKLLFKLE